MHQNFVCISCFHLFLLKLGPTKFLKLSYLHEIFGRITILHILISGLLARRKEDSELNDCQNLLKRSSSWSPWILFLFVIYLNLGSFWKGSDSSSNIFTIIFSFEENTKYRIQTLPNKHFSWKCWELTTKRLLLADPPTDRKSITCSHRVQHPSRRWLPITSRSKHYDLIIWGDYSSRFKTQNYFKSVCYIYQG
jgi:hypothetical protein